VTERFQRGTLCSMRRPFDMRPWRQLKRRMLSFGNVNRSPHHSETASRVAHSARKKKYLGLTDYGRNRTPLR
jgi:hypothetical protein